MFKTAGVMVVGLLLGAFLIVSLLRASADMLGIISLVLFVAGVVVGGSLVATVKNGEEGDTIKVFAAELTRFDYDSGRPRELGEGPPFAVEFLSGPGASGEPLSYWKGREVEVIVRRKS